MSFCAAGKGGSDENREETPHRRKITVCCTGIAGVSALNKPAILSIVVMSRVEGHLMTESCRPSQKMIDHPREARRRHLPSENRLTETIGQLREMENRISMGFWVAAGQPLAGETS